MGLTRKERQIEFSLVQYVPDIVNGRCINIGVVVLERRDGRVLSADARFNCEEERILAFDSDADVDLLQALCKDIEEKLQDPQERESFLRTLEESFSDSLQLSERKAIATADPAAELDTLARLYLPPAPLKDLSSQV